jgi:hypothetical protein
MRNVALAIAFLAIGVARAEAFKDIECKAKTEMMITKPGAYDRVVALVHAGKAKAAKSLVLCMIGKGRGVFIVGKPAHGRPLFVPVSTGDCVGETYRPHLVCPGDAKHK